MPNESLFPVKSMTMTLTSGETLDIKGADIKCAPPHPLFVFAPAVVLQGFSAVCSPAVTSLGDFTRFVFAHRFSHQSVH